ncbi:MAG: hypothetical protein AB1509_02980 [Chloroflexota bacterium]
MPFGNTPDKNIHGFLIFNTDVANLADFADVFQKIRAIRLIGAIRVEGAPHTDEIVKR